jgi:hypothetical protein
MVGVLVAEVVLLEVALNTEGGKPVKGTIADLSIQLVSPNRR